MSTLGIVSGSFDPITLGHLFVITKALAIVDTVHVLIAGNPAKKYFFNEDERHDIVQQSIRDALPNDYEKVTVSFLPYDEFTAIYAKEVLGATTIFRGIRNVVDFEYEHSQQLFNADIAPEVTTVFVMPPPELIQVSSSMVKSMIGMRDWQHKVTKCMPPYALMKLEQKRKENENRI